MRGDSEVDTTSLSDPVLIREDGAFLYTLPSVVDDVEMAITHVIRGEDHATNTGVQIEIFEALGRPVPAFAHYSLLVGAGRRGPVQAAGLAVDPGPARRRASSPWPWRQPHRQAGHRRTPWRRRRRSRPWREAFDFGKIGRAPARYDRSRPGAPQRRACCTP